MSERETPDVHDAAAGQPAVEPGEELARALPTPSTPGYTTFTDYLGKRWTCCTCMAEFLTYTQRCWLKLGWIKTGIDVWQLTGGAAASGGTHTQGGAGDLLFQTEDKFVLWLRDHGAPAAWRRTVAQGFAKVHVHFVLQGCPHNSPARYQLVEQKDGPPAPAGDGLTGTKPDYHRDPVRYMTWDAGVQIMKRELGLLALETGTTLVLATAVSKGAYLMTSARTSQPGASYAQGTHVYEYMPVGSTTWHAFNSLPVANGASSFIHSYGSSHPVRVRFVPKNAQASKPSVSRPVTVQVVDLPALQVKVQQLTTQRAALQAELDRLKGGQA